MLQLQVAVQLNQLNAVLSNQNLLSHRLEKKLGLKNKTLIIGTEINDQANPALCERTHRCTSVRHEAARVSRTGTVRAPA